MQIATLGDLDGAIVALLNEAINRWHDDGWLRAGDDEVSCTVRVVNFMHEARRADSRFYNLTVEFEATELTAAMLAGTETPRHARRPDLRLRMHESSRRVECKLVSERSPIPRAYVYQGIHRFVSGAYPTPDGIAYMVGYAAPRTDIAAAVNKIDQQVRGHPEMNPSTTLTALGGGAGHTWYRSTHPVGLLTAPARPLVTIEHAIVALT